MFVKGIKTSRVLTTDRILKEFTVDFGGYLNPCYCELIMSHQVTILECMLINYSERDKYN